MAGAAPASTAAHAVSVPITFTIRLASTQQALTALFHIVSFLTTQETLMCSPLGAKQFCGKKITLRHQFHKLGEF